MILTFGKHKGKTVEEVMKIDPSYIGWAVEKEILPDLDEKTKRKALQELHMEQADSDAVFESEHGDWGDR